jgi:hypothetical protein
MLFKFLACIVQEKNKYKDCKHLLILKIIPSKIQISSTAFLSSHWSIFSCVNSWLAFETNLGSQAVFMQILESQASTKKMEQASKRGLLERFSQ